MATIITANQYNNWLKRFDDLRIKHGRSKTGISNVSTNSVITASKMNSLLESSIEYTDGSIDYIKNKTGIVTKGHLIEQSLFTNIDLKLSEMEKKETVNYETIAILDKAIGICSFIPKSGTNLDYDLEKHSYSMYNSYWYNNYGERIEEYLRYKERISYLCIMNDDEEKHRKLKGYLCMKTDFANYKSSENNTMSCIIIVPNNTTLKSEFDSGSIHLYTSSSSSGGTEFSFDNVYSSDLSSYYATKFTPNTYIKIGKNNTITNSNSNSSWDKVCGSAGFTIDYDSYIDINFGANHYSTTERHILDFDFTNPGTVGDPSIYIWGYTD